MNRVYKQIAEGDIRTLDELPFGSVVLDRDGDAWQRRDSGWTCTERGVNTQDQSSEPIAVVLGPLQVIYRPDQDQPTTEKENQHG